MDVYNPHTFVARPLGEYITAPVTVDYMLVRSGLNSCWFALHVPTNTSKKIAELDDNMIGLFRRAAIIEDLSERFVSACHQAVNSGRVADRGASALKALEMAERYGDAVMFEVESRAKADGFSRDDIAIAYDILFEPIGEVPTTKVSEMLEG
jgi:hypothetical protein